MKKTVELQGKILELLVKTLELWQIFSLSYEEKILELFENAEKKSPGIRVQKSPGLDVQTHCV